MAGQSVEILGKHGKRWIVDMDRKDFSNFERGYWGPE
jgi:hypothetical protein